MKVNMSAWQIRPISCRFLSARAKSARWEWTRLNFRTWRELSGRVLFKRTAHEATRSIWIDRDWGAEHAYWCRSSSCISLWRRDVPPIASKGSFTPSALRSGARRYARIRENNYDVYNNKPICNAPDASVTDPEARVSAALRTQWRNSSAYNIPLLVLF